MTLCISCSKALPGALHHVSLTLVILYYRFAPHSKVGIYACLLVRVLAKERVGTSLHVVVISTYLYLLGVIHDGLQDHSVEGLL